MFFWGLKVCPEERDATVRRQSVVGFLLAIFFSKCSRLLPQFQRRKISYPAGIFLHPSKIQDWKKTWANYLQDLGRGNHLKAFTTILLFLKATQRALHFSMLPLHISSKKFYVRWGEMWGCCKWQTLSLLKADSSVIVLSKLTKCENS